MPSGRCQAGLEMEAAVTSLETRVINDKVRLLAKLGAALLEAKESGADLQRRSSPRSAGTSWRAVSKRRNA
jgi:hypothetical protein